MTGSAGRSAEENAARTFVLQNTSVLSPPLVPEIRLYLAHEALPLWEKTEEELDASGLPPPYWAFAWAGGQAIARYVLDHPELVRGRDVLDMAAGSGLVAIAAMQAGAAGGTASDLDTFALEAIRLNAQENDVIVTTTASDLIGSDAGWDAILVGDAFYERPLAERLLPWIETLARRGALVLIGDPGRAYFPRDRFELLETYEVPVTRALEDCEIKVTRVWRM